MKTLRSTDEFKAAISDIDHKDALVKVFKESLGRLNEDVRVVFIVAEDSDGELMTLFHYPQGENPASHGKTIAQALAMAVERSMNMNAERGSLEDLIEDISKGKKETH